MHKRRSIPKRMDTAIMQEQVRRQPLSERMESSRREVRANNPDITAEEQAMEIADQFTREALASLVKKGKIKFTPPVP